MSLIHFSLSGVLLIVTASVGLANCNNAISENEVLDSPSLRKCLLEKDAEILALARRLDALEADSKVFDGAVIAFYSSERGFLGACPNGWALFREAGGRVIVGAGAHENEDENGVRLTRYPSFKDAPIDAVGGAEKHKLSEGEMPTHTHRLNLLDGNDSTGGSRLQGGDAPQSAYREEANALHSSGESEFHNNMPPYISLYFCKKA